jgi:multicomponent Na+:H+ antiporter subunit G
MEYLDLIRNPVIIVNSVSFIIIAIGCFMVFTSVVGIFRMPDFFTKMHAASVGDSFGCPLILLGLAIYGGLNLISFKIILLILFLFITNPTASYALAQAALKDGINPYGEKFENDDERDTES